MTFISYSVAFCQTTKTEKNLKWSWQIVGSMQWEDSIHASKEDEFYNPSFLFFNNRSLSDHNSHCMKNRVLLRDPQESNWTRPPDDCRGVALGDPPCHQQNTFYFVCSWWWWRTQLFWRPSIAISITINSFVYRDLFCVLVFIQKAKQIYNIITATILLVTKRINHSPPPLPPNMDISVVVDDAAIVVLTTVMTTHQTGTRFGCFRWFPNNFVFFSLE